MREGWKMSSTKQIQLEKKNVWLGCCSCCFTKHKKKKFFTERNKTQFQNRSRNQYHFLPRSCLSFFHGGLTFSWHPHSPRPTSIVSELNGKEGTTIFHFSESIPSIARFCSFLCCAIHVFHIFIDLATAHKTLPTGPPYNYNPYSFGAHFQMDHAWAKVIHMFPLQNDEGKFQPFSPFLIVSTRDFFPSFL